MLAPDVNGNRGGPTPEPPTGDSNAYERLRGAPSAPGSSDGVHAEIRALRDKVRQLEAENALLREQLEALRPNRTP